MTCQLDVRESLRSTIQTDSLACVVETEEQDFGVLVHEACDCRVSARKSWERGKTPNGRPSRKRTKLSQHVPEPVDDEPRHVISVDRQRPHILTMAYIAAAPCCDVVAESRYAIADSSPSAKINY